MVAGNARHLLRVCPEAAGRRIRGVSQRGRGIVLRRSNSPDARNQCDQARQSIGSISMGSKVEKGRRLRRSAPLRTNLVVAGA